MWVVLLGILFEVSNGLSLHGTYNITMTEEYTPPQFAELDQPIPGEFDMFQIQKVNSPIGQGYLLKIY